MEAALPLIAAFVGDSTSSDKLPQSPPHITKTTKSSQLTEHVAVFKVRVVVFSKDRPFQLRSLLRSINKYVVGAKLDIVVIWRTNNANSYAPVIREFGDSAVAFVQETGCGDFRHLLTTACTGREFTLFCVDDALMFVTAHPLDAISRTCQSGTVAWTCELRYAYWSSKLPTPGYSGRPGARRHPRILAFQLKLSPHVCWSHPADASCVCCAELKATNRF